MAQHIQVRVRTADMRMYSCHTSYACCNYQWETLEKKRKLFNTPPELYLELWHVKPKKLENCGRLSSTEKMRTRYYSVFVYVRTYSKGNYEDR